jgi:O-antigen/teichoic acid export membrane protein
LLGRLVSKGANFAVQILVVRYLSRTDYGAFAYALSIVSIVQSIATFGLDRSVTRFVPIYHEQRSYDKLFGTLLMSLGTCLSLGMLLALLLHAFKGIVAGSFLNDAQALSLLLVLIFLGPVQAIDDLLVGMFAVFASPRAIFFRKHLLAPGLRLIVVLFLCLGRCSVFFLAAGYLGAGVLGVAICMVILWRMIDEQGLFEHLNIRTVTLPWREVLAFTVPLLTSDLVYVVMNSLGAVQVGYFCGSSEVAALRAVQPAALLNQLVMASFATLFTPGAARMFARNDRVGINSLYWKTAIWIAVFSFPIFALTFSLASPITVLLFGRQYQDAALILALLSLGHYCNAALGFNGLTLKVYGKLRYVVVLNVVTVFASLGMNLLFIPQYGALGAAIGTCVTLFLHNILKQAGLGMGTGINLFEWRYFQVYLTIILAASGLFVVQWATCAPVYVSIGLAVLGSLWVIRFSRHELNVRQTFPEILRLRFMRRLLG